LDAPSLMEICMAFHKIDGRSVCIESKTNS
jgi:hypothetical protein